VQTAERGAWANSRCLTSRSDPAYIRAGEFLRLLRELAPDEDKFYAEGAEEVEEEIKKMK
jgi:hypothetical protein